VGRNRYFHGVLCNNCSMCVIGYLCCNRRLWTWARDEGTGTRPDYLVNRADQKINEGPSGEKNCIEIEK